jgi:exosortase
MRLGEFIMNMAETTSAAAVPVSGQLAGKGNHRSFWKWAWLVPPLGYLWFHLIDNLRLEWESNPQYSYGMVVPILVVGLLVLRWPRLASAPAAAAVPIRLSAICLCVFLAFLYLPTRLVEAATPEWRPLQWLLALEVIGLTLFAVYLAGGRAWLRQAAFPVLFFLVALPWPTPIEAPVIQSLSRANAGLVVVVMEVLNVPAIQHGNVVEVGTGMVGINDACSGIRSLQSSLMISLFFGEFYFLSWRRRALLLPISVAVAMLLNLCRTSLLTWIAAQKGIGAIAQYHDEAGFTILMICAAMLWGVAWLMHRGNPPVAPGGRIAPIPSPAMEAVVGGVTSRRVVRFGIVLIAWLVAVETSVVLWYRIRESHLQPGPNWTVKLPEQNSTFQRLPFTPEQHELLRFDEGQQGEWQESDGTGWQAFYYNWVPGRVAGYLAKRHTPDICMTATGYKLLSGPELMVLDINHVELPMRHYVFASSGGPLQVYQCHWEAGMGRDTYTANESARFNLIRGIWAGRGNRGQKVLEVIISGYENPDLARQALVRQLSDLIAVEN